MNKQICSSHHFLNARWVPQLFVEQRAGDGQKGKQGSGIEPEGCVQVANLEQSLPPLLDPTGPRYLSLARSDYLDCDRSNGPLHEPVSELERFKPRKGNGSLKDGDQNSNR